MDEVVNLIWNRSDEFKKESWWEISKTMADDFFNWMHSRIEWMKLLDIYSIKNVLSKIKVENNNDWINTVESWKWVDVNLLQRLADKFSIDISFKY
jgi:hypothetical protein